MNWTFNLSVNFYMKKISHLFVSSISSFKVFFELIITVFSDGGDGSDRGVHRGGSGDSQALPSVPRLSFGAQRMGHTL